MDGRGSNYAEIGKSADDTLLCCSIAFTVNGTCKCREGRATIET